MVGDILVKDILLEIFRWRYLWRYFGWQTSVEIYHLVGSELQSSGRHGKKAKTKENPFIWAKISMLTFLSTIISVKQMVRMFLLWMIELAEDEGGKVIQPQIIQHGYGHHGLVRSMMMIGDEDHAAAAAADDDDVHN